MPARLGAGAENLVEIAHVAGRLGAVDRRQADPQHRHAFTLEGCNHVVDALCVKLGPFVGVIVVTAGRALAWRLARGDRRLLAVRLGGIGWRGLVLVLRLGLRLRRLRGLRRRFRRHLVAERQPVVETEHDHDGARLLVDEGILDDARPFERIVLGIVANEARGRPDVAHHADVRSIGQHILEPISEPIGHGIADHHDRRCRRRLELARRWRLVGFDRRRRRPIEWIVLVAAAAGIAEKREREEAARWRRAVRALAVIDCSSRRTARRPESATRQCRSRARSQAAPSICRFRFVINRSFSRSRPGQPLTRRSWRSFPSF